MIIGAFQKWRELGYTSLEDFLVGFFLARDPNNLLTMLSTWTNGNVGNTPGFDGSVEKALASIKVPLRSIQSIWDPDARIGGKQLHLC